MKLKEVCEKVVSEHTACLIRQRKDSEAGELDYKETFTGKKKGWILLDAFTASTVSKVFNELCEKNQQKLNSMEPGRAVNTCWNLIG